MIFTGFNVLVLVCIICTKHINKNGRGKMKLFNYQYSVVTKLHGKKTQHLVLVGISLMIISHVFFLSFQSHINILPKEEEV